MHFKVAWNRKGQGLNDAESHYVAVLIMEWIGGQINEKRDSVV
jgi:hypothetical protein